MNTNFSWGIVPYRISDIVTMIKDKKLILRPEYQRRSVWSKPAKSSLIETVLQNKPVPLFLIREKKDGVLEVIDGQQRLRAISEFQNNDFSLSGVHTEINGKTYSDLNTPLFEEFDYKSKFDEYQLYFNLIKDADEDEIIDMYMRVNKYTINLNKMELKYALNHDTDFLNLVEELSYDEDILNFFLISNIFTQKSVDRMGDIELFTLILAFILNGNLSNKDESIREAFSAYSEMDAKLIEDSKIHFNETLDLIKLMFSGDEFKEYFEEKEIKTAEYYLKNMRFRQKNDFLSLFYVFFKLKDIVNFKDFDPSVISEIRNFLIYMDSEIAPSSDLTIVSEYGVKCVSQSNSKTSREFRSKFILEGIDYAIKQNNFEKLNFFSTEKLDVVESIFDETNKLYDIDSELIVGKSTFKDLLDVIWTSDEEQ